MKYEVEIFESYPGIGGRQNSYSYDSIEKVKGRIQHLQNYETLLSVLEYHLVYQHPFVLPICDKMTIFSKHEIYYNWVTIPTDKIQTAKQKDYKHNFIDSNDFTHYCLTYETLTKHPNQGYIYKVRATYDLKNSNRQSIMKALYEHSRSNRIFNLRLYQYRILEETTLLSQ